jgi:MFS family permease
VFGRITPGYVADKVGRYNTMSVMNYLSAILILAVWLPTHGNAPIIVFSSLYGFTSGAFVSLAPSLIAQISDVRKIGVRTGSMFALTSIAALFGNPIAGAIVKHNHGSFWGVQVFAGIMIAVGSCFFVAARVSLKGFDLKAKV